MSSQHSVNAMLSLVGGLVLAGTTLVVAPAAAQSVNPLTQILTKENDILSAIQALPPPAPPTDLSGVTRAWDKKLTSGRFTVLSAFGGAAVRDNETGLVWETTPSTQERTWYHALSDCADKVVGGRKGWRLPSMPELTSLIDPSVALPGPTLPADHPFTNIQSAGYWSATTDPQFSTNAWDVFLNLADHSVHGKTDFLNRVWCVRGGMNAEAY